MDPMVRLVVLMMLCSRHAYSMRNVLFLIADDMRTETGLHTPNLDELAGRSLVMNNAFVQMAVCAPSRTSFMTGRRPDTTHSYDTETYWRKEGGNFTTLPQYFKENGYETAGIGKTFHAGQSSGNNDPLSWTLPYLSGDRNHESKDKSWEAIDDDVLVDSPLIDEQVATMAIQRLNLLADDARFGVKPFFLAVGFHKPHLPFVFPESMLQHYPESSISVPDNKYAPENTPRIALGQNLELQTYNDMSSYTGGSNTILSDQDIRALRRAYYASITWVDLQIGRVLGELKSLGLAENTVVSFIGDHGYLLGEHAKWGKKSNFELATRAPMMIHVPNVTDAGLETESITEFVDLFPTLVDLVGISPLDQCDVDSSEIVLCTEGTSLKSLFNDTDSQVKTAAFSQTKRPKVMGYSIRTRRFRYTEWVQFDYNNFIPNWETRNPRRELYDHENDMGENFNIVDQKPKIAKNLSARLRSGWRNAIINK